MSSRSTREKINGDLSTIAREWTSLLLAFVLIILNSSLLLCLVHLRGNRIKHHGVSPLFSQQVWGCQYRMGRVPLYDILWCENIDVANEMYSTDFIQGVLDGSLPPAEFSRIQLQSAYWSRHASIIWRHKFSRFYSSRSHYLLQRHNATLSNIHPSPEIMDYVRFVEDVSYGPPPDNAIAIAAEGRLWFEVVKRMRRKGALYLSGPYKEWIQDIMTHQSLIQSFAYLSKDYATECEITPKTVTLLSGVRLKMSKRHQTENKFSGLKRCKTESNDGDGEEAATAEDLSETETLLDKKGASPEKTKKFSDSGSPLASIDTARKIVEKSVVAGKHPKLKDLFIDTDWASVLGNEIEKSYFSQLQTFLESEWDHPQVTVYPPSHLIFRAFQLTPFNQVRVVLLGQDPYHGHNQATGLCFSVPRSERLPSSLKNVYTEIESDLDTKMPRHGDLTHWAEQGVLLLNTVLTVRASKAYSHQKQGWERLTSSIISLLNKERPHLVFLLWGRHAQRCGENLDGERHLVLKSSHPSGLSAHRGFIGCKHFSQCNAYLESHGFKPIDWKI